MTAAHSLLVTPFETLEGQSDVRPRPTAMWLPIRTIKAAATPAHEGLLRK